MNEDPRSGPGLFDLPLGAPPPAPPPAPEVAARPGAPAPPARTLPLFDDEPARAPSPEIVAGPGAEAARRGRPVPVPRPPELRRPHLRRRLISAAGNFVILAASGVVAGFGAAAMGATLSTAAAPALALFLLSFSFLYSVVPLAFWGSTPGMSWAGLVARNGTTEPLAFGQTVWRWLAGWLVVATAGLLGLVALSGRSLADRLSGSSTFELDPAV